MRSVLFLLIFSLTICVHAVADQKAESTLDGFSAPYIISPYKASYRASYNGLPIKTTNTVSTTDSGYYVHTRAENFLGFIEEKEYVEVTDDGNITPLKYEYQRSLIGNKRAEVTLFDPAAGEAKNTYKKRTLTFGLDEKLLAPLSYQLKMRQDLMAGKEEFHYRVIYRNKIRDYKFAIVGKETLSTAIGNFETVKIRRLRDTDERDTLLWLAPSLDYLPVQLLQEEDGETYELQLASYEAKALKKAMR